MITPDTDARRQLVREHAARLQWRPESSATLDSASTTVFVSARGCETQPVVVPTRSAALTQPQLANEDA
jgi:hypothetical protein